MTDQADTPAPPASIDAEMAILGAVLYDNEAFHLADDLQAEHFYEPFHQRLWAAISERIAKGLVAEPTGLAQRAASDGAFQHLGGYSYFALLIERAPPSYLAREHAATIRDAYLRREIVQVCDVATEQARMGAQPAVEVLAEAETAIFKLGESGTSSGGFTPFAHGLDMALDHAAAAMARDGGLAGLSTGLLDLDRKLGGLHPSDLLILAGRPSMGKAQPLSAEVLMRDGSWKAMGDLAFGDQLASVDGAPSTVAGVFPQGERDVFRVTFSDGRSTRCCGEHLWRVESSKLSGPQVVSTDQLRAMLERDRFKQRVSVPLVSGHFGNPADLPVDPWLLGVLLGNGSIGEGRLSISTADAATLFRVQRIVGAHRVRASGEAGYDYRIADAGCAPEDNVRLALRRMGLEGRHSHDKFVPAAYLAASREQRLELLRGLLDTDGWVETFGAVRIALSSQQLALDVQTLVRSLGGRCTISEKHPSYTHLGEKREGLVSYVCNVSHPERATLLTLRRKQRRCEGDLRFRAPTIASIVPDGREPVQCIAVTHPSRLYVTDDYIVTHNTALATNIAHNAARTGACVGFFSLEMSKEQLAHRLLADVAGISSDKIRKGEIEMHELRQLRDAAGEVRSIPLEIDDTGGISIAKLTARARRLKRTRGLDLLVVDYLQLITVPDARGQGRVQEVSTITQALKALAKDLNIPVLALSQLSRAVETREDKRPQLSDLRESGSIEQDADVVMFVYREAYYLGRAEPKLGSTEHLTWEEEMMKAEGKAEVIIGKQRHGPIGTVHLAFNDNLTRFGNLAREERYPARSYGYADA